MTDYTKLVAALRCKELKGIACPDCYERECAANSGKGLYCRVPQLLDDAADAIEALQAKNTDIREELFVSQRKYDNFVAVASMENAMLAKQMPKRGEWKRVEDGETYHYECSECGERPLYSRFGDIVLSGVCPMCGAKMEVQE